MDGGKGRKGADAAKLTRRRRGGGESAGFLATSPATTFRMALAPIRFPQRVIDAPCHQSPDIIGPLESIGIIIGGGGALGSDGGGAFMLLYVFTVSTMEGSESEHRLQPAIKPAANTCYSRSPRDLTTQVPYYSCVYYVHEYYL